MKERNFRFRKSFAEVIRVMDDKQAGKFIKAVCDYVFDGRGYDGNDTAIKTAFTLVKVTLDAEKTDRENGRRGGIKSREIRKAQDQKPSVAKVIAGGIMAGEMLKSILESQNEQSDEDDEPTENKFEKGAFEKQDKVFPNYRENDMKNKSETDFSERRLKWAEK